MNTYVPQHSGLGHNLSVHPSECRRCETDRRNGTRHRFIPGPDALLCAECGQPYMTTPKGRDFYHVTDSRGRHSR